MEEIDKTQSAFSLEQIKKRDELKEIFEQKYTEALDNPDIETIVAVTDRLSNFRDKLFSHYGQVEVQRRLLFHIIAHSGTNEQSDLFDFDEPEYSIETFINTF